jgi:hypothetical protein
MMKRIFFPVIVFVFLLTACAGVKARVPDDPYAKESQVVVEKWIAAFRDLDAEALLSLYSDEVTFVDCGDNFTCDVEDLVNLQGVVPLSFRQEGFKVETQSYMITAFGRFAVLQVMYAEPPGIPTSTPATVILEFKDGKILKEMWYY